MGRYKTDSIYWSNKYYSPEDLISWGFSCASAHPDVTKEIAAHILIDAFTLQDDNLFNAGNELMGAAGSPHNYVASESSKQATANNNRPSESVVPKIPNELLNINEEIEKEWNASMDYIFDPKVNAQKVYEAMKSLKSVKGKKYDNKIKEKRFYYVFYRICAIINYFSEGTTPSQYLKWVNLHFKHNWPEDKTHLRFQLEGSAKELADHHPSEWGNCMKYGGLGKIHYRLAIDLKNTFTFVVEEKREIKDSELYEHLKDYPQFLSGAKLIYDMWYVPDDAYINKG